MFIRILRSLGLLHEANAPRPVRTSISLLRDIVQPTGTDIRRAIDDLEGWADAINAIESYVAKEAASPTSTPSPEISLPGTEKQFRFALEVMEDSLIVLFSGSSSCESGERYRVRLYC